MTAGTQQAMNFESHRLCTIKAKQELRIGTWSILPFDIEHDANEPVAFLLQSTLGYKVLYVTDTKYLKYKFNGITHMMLEVNYIYEQIQENIKNGSVHSTLGYKVLYVTDTKYLKYKFNGITHMMLEVNYIYEQIQENIKNGSVHSTLANRIMESHFSLEHAIGMLKANDLTRLEEIHLIHLSSQNSNAKYIKSEIQKVTGAPVYVGGL